VTASASRAILLDFGGVIWNMRWDIARQLEGAHGLPDGALFETLYRTERWRAVERGRGDREAWLAEAHAALERLAGRALPALHAEWRRQQAPIAANIELIRALRPAWRLAVVSNSDTTLRTRLSDGLGIIGLFDDVVCSAEVGWAKPEAEIYALACRRLGVPPGACVFVDDHEPNVQAADSAGMRGLLYRVDRGDDLRRLLAAVGVVAVGA
jgi:putative hydrolase of the HAD superfamily